VRKVMVALWEEFIADVYSGRVPGFSDDDEEFFLRLWGDGSGDGFVWECLCGRQCDTFAEYQARRCVKCSRPRFASPDEVEAKFEAMMERGIDINALLNVSGPPVRKSL
jgi:hypothetical protein